MFISINEVYAKVVKEPKPLIFFDTCTILDTVRSLHNEDIEKTHAETVIKLMELNKDREIYLVTYQNVHEEWKDNIENVVDEARRKIYKIEKNIKVILSMINMKTGLDIKGISTRSHNIEVYAKEISEKLLNSCSQIKREDSYAVKAMARVRGNITPAKRGKSEAKDCEIIECFLDISKSLRDNKFTDKIFFITSNINDYGKNSSLLAPLDVAFKDLKATYINNISQLLQLLRK